MLTQMVAGPAGLLVPVVLMPGATAPQHRHQPQLLHRCFRSKLGTVYYKTAFLSCMCVQKACL